MSNYSPVTCVWEITMGCNMRCKHCGSSCSDPLPDELTTEEALSLTGQLADIGLKWITLSGGEPLTRTDWPLLAQSLNRRGVVVNIISNGWLITDDIVEQMVKSKLATVALSVDGTREVHDKIRKPGSFDRLEGAFSRMKRAGLTCGAVTTVSKENLSILPQMKEELVRMGVDSWQLQLGLPMGNLAKRPEWLLAPRQMNDLINFCYETSMEGRIVIFPADCIGYYSHKDLQIKRKTFGMPGYSLWDGCNAGIRSFGILHNGDILGCTSIRDKSYVEGSIREQSLSSIWDDESKFTWRRTMQKEQLDGECTICKYGSKCLGGCPNTRLTMHGTIYGENDFCAYNVSLKKCKAGIEKKTGVAELFQEAMSDVQRKEHQLAAFKLERLLELDPNHVEAWKVKGFADFMNGNYTLCEAANKAALALQPNDPYARKGLGLALHRMNNTEDGAKLLEEVIAESQYRDGDAIQDLLFIYRESGKHEQVQHLLQRVNSARAAV